MYLLKIKSSLHLPVESNLHEFRLTLVRKTDKQIQIGLPVIWTGHTRLKIHYVKAFYISFVTLIKFLKERPIFHQYQSSLLRHDVTCVAKRRKISFPVQLK